jgi:hypothetical protein
MAGILMIALVAVCGCSLHGSETPREYKELFYLPLEQQEKRFKQFPLDKQVDIYVRAMYVEPPLTRYASYLASNGKDVLPFLAARLEAEKSETAKAHLFYAFRMIHEHTYSLKNDESTLKLLEREIVAMSDQYRKNQCEAYLKAISDTPGFVP